MKPGSKDVKYSVLITGLELEELQKYAWDMPESFGLDRRIENYRGKRPIGLYRWDIELLYEVVEDALKDGKEYPDKNSQKYVALKNLYQKLQKLYEEAFAEA